MANEKEINVLELRKHFGETLDHVHAEKQTFIITRNGRPTAVLVDIHLYRDLLSGTVLAGTGLEPAPKEEDRFIEIYTQERIGEFMREDRLKSK